MTNPAITQAQNHGYELAHPSIHLISELLEHVGPTDPKLQDLHHHTGQQQDIQEESVIDGAEARGLEPDQ